MSRPGSRALGRPAGPLRSSCCAPAELSAAEVEELWQLMRRFVERERDEFECTLRACDRVYRYRNRHGLQGLLATRTLPVNVDGRTTTVIYLQWYHVAPTCRGRTPAIWSGLDLVRRALLGAPGRPVVVIFSAATWLSYLLFARNTVEGAPLRGARGGRYAGLLDAAMRELAPARWDPVRGVIRGAGSWRYLEGRISPATPTGDPDVSTFALLNPGHFQGDCLVCAFPITLANLVYALGRRLLKALGLRSRRRRRECDAGALRVGSRPGSAPAC